MSKQVNEQAVEKKGGAVGEGVGLAAGGLAGMKLGAALGSFAGPVGTVVGGVAGGAIGAFAGSSLGKQAGELGGKVMNFFSGDKKQEIPTEAAINTTTGAAAFPLTSSTEKTATPVQKASTPKVDTTKDYTKDPKYQKLLQEEQDVIKGRNVRTAGEGREASETLSVSQVREAEREAKSRYLGQTSLNVEPVPGKNTGMNVTRTSTENTELTREASKPAPAPPSVVMNNTTNTGGGTQISPVKPVPRSYSGSPLDRHIDKVSTF